MNCLDDSLIQAYIDNELGELDRQMVTEHITSCSLCHKQYQLLKGQKKQVLEAINLWVDPVEIPVFSYPEKKQAETNRSLSYWFYISAACVFFILLLTTYQPEQDEMYDIFMYPSLGDQVDANLPLSQQDFSITIIDGGSIESECQ